MKAEQLRKSILQLAIQGKLVPQDPADEPASVLLERIRAEKQRLIKEGKIKKDKGDSVIFKCDDNCYYEKTGPEVKNITDEIPFDIPDSWCFTRFSSLILINGGYAFKSENYVAKENGVRVLRISDFNEKGFNQKRPVYHKYTPELKSFELGVNDIIMCMTGGTVGKSFFVSELPEPMLVNQRVADIKINDILNKKYCYHFILSPYIQRIIDESKNSTNDNISVALINSFIVPVPPLAEQERIVAEIEKFEPLIAEYDKLEQQATKLDDEIYDKLKKSILQYAIQGKLVPQDSNDEPAAVLLERIRAGKKAQLGKKYVESYIYKSDDNCYYEKVGSGTKNITDEIPFDIPDSWEWARVDTLFHHNTGKALNSANTKGNYREYITTSNLYWNYFKLDSLKKMLFTDEEIDKCSLKKGDLLVCEGGDIGRAAIWNYDIPMCIQNHIHRLRAYSAVETKFYYCVLYLYKQLGIIGGKGIGIQGLSTKALGRIIFPVPPLAEQKRIIEQINVIFSKFKDEI